MENIQDTRKISRCEMGKFLRKPKSNTTTLERRFEVIQGL